MGSLFGKPKINQQKTTKQQPKNNITEKDRAILELKNARDKLKKYKKKLEVDSEKLTNQAKELIKQNQKNRALLVLKLKRHKEKDSDNLDNQLLSVFRMIEDIEWESTNIKVLEALKSGTKALNQLHDEMSVDDVETLLSETNEAIEVENQINKLLAGQLKQLDDEELLKELDDLISTENVTNTPKMILNNKKNDNLDLPEAPSHQILPEAPQSNVLLSEVPNQPGAILS